MIEFPEISVILPFYNAENTLQRAIESVIKQTFTNYELILVNNFSNDKSSSIAKAWVSKDSRVKLIDEKKQGVAYASNTGLYICRGKYICRMDADDEMLPERLALQKKFLDTNPEIQVLAGRVKYISHQNDNLGFERFVDWNNQFLSEEEISLNRFIELPIVNPTLMWRKNISDNYELYRQGNFPEDYELILRWLELGIRITKIPEVILKWYDSEGRLTRTDSKYSDLAFTAIKSQFLVRWLKKNNPYHPYVTVWGASRISRKRVQKIEELGIIVENYVDIKKSRKLDKPVLYYKDIPEPGNIFILTYVKQPDARAKTRKFLLKKGYVEGKNYISVS